MLGQINNTNILKGIWIHPIKADPDRGCISVCWFNDHLLRILSHTNHTTQRQPSDQCAACSVLTLQFSDWNLKYGHSTQSQCIGGQSNIEIDCYNFTGKSQLYPGHITVTTSDGVDINKKCCLLHTVVVNQISSVAGTILWEPKIRLWCDDNPCRSAAVCEAFRPSDQQFVWHQVQSRSNTLHSLFSRSMCLQTGYH